MGTLRLTLRGAAALGVLGLVVTAAILTGTPELSPLAVAIAVPLGVGPWLAHRRARQSLERAEVHAHVEPGTVEVGTGMWVRLSLTNRSPDTTFPPLGMAATTLPWRARGAPARAVPRRGWLAPSVVSLLALPRPGPGRTESFVLDVPTARRGILELVPQQTWAHDPFGLIGARGPATPVVFAAVLPSPVHLDLPIAAMPSATTGASTARFSALGPGMGELEGIRPYVAGDRLSLLHWPAKARYGTWFVRHFGAEGGAVLSIVLDDRAGVHRRAEFERLISVALGMVDDTTRSDQAVCLTTLSGRSFSFEPSEPGRMAVRLALAELNPGVVQSSEQPALIPSDGVILTTRTGAERLKLNTPTTPSLVPSDHGAGTGAPTSRILVV
jgi:uncharacterized protein (DUF58 family)